MTYSARSTSRAIRDSSSGTSHTRPASSWTLTIIATGGIVPIVAAGVAVLTVGRSETMAWFRTGSLPTYTILAACLQIVAGTALGIVRASRPLPVPLHFVLPALMLGLGLLQQVNAIAVGSVACSAISDADVFGMLAEWARVLVRAAVPVSLGAAIACGGMVAVTVTGVVTWFSAQRNLQAMGTSLPLVGLGVAGSLLSAWLAFDSIVTTTPLAQFVVTWPRPDVTSYVASLRTLFLSSQLLWPVTAAALGAVGLSLGMATRRSANGGRKTLAGVLVTVLLFGLVVAATAATRLFREHAHATLTRSLGLQWAFGGHAATSRSTLLLSPALPLIAILDDSVRVNGQSVGHGLSADTTKRLSEAVSGLPRNERWAPVAIAFDASMAGTELEQTIGWLRTSGAFDVELMVEPSGNQCRSRDCLHWLRLLPSLGAVGHMISLLAGPKTSIPVRIGNQSVCQAGLCLGLELGRLGNTMYLKSRLGSIVVKESIGEALRRVKQDYPDETRITVHAAGLSSFQELVQVLDSSRAAEPVDGRDSRLFDETFLVETELALDPGGARLSFPARSVGESRVFGALAFTDIKTVVDANKNRIQHCYEAELARTPDLRGSVVVRWIIGAMGTVAPAIVYDSTLHNRNVEDCMVKTVRTWAFPQPAGGGVADVRWSFIFAPP